MQQAYENNLRQATRNIAIFNHFFYKPGRKTK